jgi:hypothetical protein
MRPILSILFVLVVFVFGGCAGEVDLPPDGSGSSDSYVWVDSYAGSNGSHDQANPWPQPEAGYTGSPFGCEHDRDCFGLRCCKSPWGVKLCAASCD